jgi:tRNA A37 threonylcarbamoyladenosine synthetase subunit TsaC/SUA5/YrdC
MLTGKHRSAEMIMSRGLPGMPSSSFVLINDRTVAYRCPEHKQTTALTSKRSPLIIAQAETS